MKGDTQRAKCVGRTDIGILAYTVTVFISFKLHYCIEMFYQIRSQIRNILNLRDAMIGAIKTMYWRMCAQM